MSLWPSDNQELNDMKIMFDLQMKYGWSAHKSLALGDVAVI